MTLIDETEITFSDIQIVDGQARVQVYAERPNSHGFDSAECLLPDYATWRASGFTSEEEENLKRLIKKGSHLFFKFAAQGGIRGIA